MSEKKRIHPKIKARLHPRNKHRERYNFEELKAVSPGLSNFVRLNNYKDQSIDFSDPDAVKALNQALILKYYDLEYWDIPEGFLCPPVPGRADYIHYIADMLRNNNYGKTPLGASIKCLDIGIGANCIYPIIGTKEYGWSFVGSDIEQTAILSANKIISSNPNISDLISCRLQANSNDFFKSIIREDEVFDVTICNPPFHASAKDAEAVTLRKLRNLEGEETSRITKNFGGNSNELWTKGGEEHFISKMIFQSQEFSKSCFWFSSLVSKKSNLKTAYSTLEKTNATQVETIPMGQGNKTSRLIVWTFLSEEEQKKWKNTRWIRKK